ncbi:hypothetical protein J8M97_25375 [Gordonia polyisoprenivorans]|uniref:hypothetical protein n=1 Tax=Gordonia polyisoprenivorans TaxID=84595 RepID=UPI000380F761|nr:hypothetical protein [Gordonia polyisoprenivorans]QUD82944.1 hypothetical protein J8M97_25375 [Gordonia polyisoprenivorans]
MQVTANARSWSPSRKFFLWFLAIGTAVVLAVGAGWVMFGAWALAVLHITPGAGTMLTADYALAFVGLGVITSMTMFGVAAPYSMTAHLGKDVTVSTRAMIEQLIHNRLIRSTLLAILLPVLLRGTGLIHPYWLGLSTTAVVDIAITYVVVDAIRAAIVTRRSSVTGTRFPHPTTLPTDPETTDEFRWKFGPDWDIPEQIREPGIAKQYASMAQRSSKQRWITGTLLGLVATKAVPASWTFMMHGTSVFVTLPFMLSVAVALGSVHLVRSASKYSDLADRYARVAVTAQQNIDPKD